MQALQVKAPEARHLLDHSEHRLHGRLAPGMNGLALPAFGDEGREATVLAKREVGRGVIAGIGQHSPCPRQGLCDLLLVVDGVADMRHDNQMAAIVGHSLGVAGLLEAVFMIRARGGRFT